MSAPEPPVKGNSAAHALEWDPPAALTAALRWTCTRCYATLIDYHGNVYGDAISDPCPGRWPRLAELLDDLADKS